MSDLDLYNEPGTATSPTPAPTTPTPAARLEPAASSTPTTTPAPEPAAEVAPDEPARTITNPHRATLAARMPRGAFRAFAIAAIAIVGWHYITTNNSASATKAPTRSTIAGGQSDGSSDAKTIVAGALNNADAYRAETGSYTGWKAPDGVRAAYNADTVIVSAQDPTGCAMGASSPQGHGIQADPTGAACTDREVANAQAQLDAAPPAVPASPATTPQATTADVAAVSAAAAQYWAMNTASSGIGYTGMTANVIPGATAVAVSSDAQHADIWTSNGDRCDHLKVNAAAEVTVVGHDCL